MMHALTFAAYSVTFNGRTVVPHARAAVVDGRVLLPVRSLGNALGADVGYDGGVHRIVVQRGAHVASLDARGTVRIVRGTAYAPLATVARAFGLGVGYEARTRTIALYQHASTPSPTAAPAPSYTVTLKPSPGSNIHDPYPTISARFAGAASIDPRSLRVVVDGRDVTADAAVIGDQVLITPRTALMPGTHSVSVTGRDAAGSAITQYWTFLDDFAFSTAPPPTPFPIGAMWIDRYIVPGVNAFNVYVPGAPGLTGYVAVDGVGGIFPLQVYGANSYVAHVIVPNGVNQPFARVGARITLPNGTPTTIVLPQTLQLITLPATPTRSPPTPALVPRPTTTPRRSVEVPMPTAIPRHFLNAPTSTPTATPAPPVPTPTPTPVRTRRLLVRKPTPTPTPTPTPAPR